MRILRWVGLNVAAVSAVLFALASPSSAQAPVGFHVKVLGTIDLAGEIPGLSNYVLRLSHVTLDPGGSLAEHSHDGRPEVVYILSGVLSESRNGGPLQDYKAGTSFITKTGIRHSFLNRGTEPAVWISAPIAAKAPGQ